MSQGSRKSDVCEHFGFVKIKKALSTDILIYLDTYNQYMDAENPINDTPNSMLIVLIIDTGRIKGRKRAAE